MTEQEQLQTQIQSLKIRLFDAGEQLQNAAATVQELQGALGQIAQLSGVAADEQGQITIQSIIDAVKALTVEPDHGSDAPDSELLEG